MTMRNRFGVIPMAGLLSLAIAIPAFADTTTTPLRNPVVLQGQSGGARQSNCGFLPNQPSQTVQVTEDFTSLVFTLEGGGEPTLWITGPNGFEQCVMADELSGGIIEIPGVWEEGTYALYIGDRSGREHRYTLRIAQE